jgi:hypothetical protein
MRNKMEKINRYNFGGFSFGENKYFNLTIEVKNFNDVGTSYTTKIAVELTDEERLELIKLLINANEKEDN